MFRIPKSVYSYGAVALAAAALMAVAPRAARAVAATLVQDEHLGESRSQ